MLAVALAPGVPTVLATVRATTAIDEAKLNQSADQSCALFGIPKVAECVDDKEAVEKAVLWANDRDVEIWDHRRFVARLPGDPLRSGVK
jgi:hypothetical protein